MSSDQKQETRWVKKANQRSGEDVKGEHSHRRGKKPHRESKAPTADDVKTAMLAFEEKSKGKTRWLVLCQSNKDLGNLPPHMAGEAAFFVIDRNPKQSPNLVMDIRDLRLLPGESFDGVIWCRTPPALIRSEKVRTELQRLIKKGGYWYFTTKFNDHVETSTPLQQLRYAETIRRKSPSGDHFTVLNKADMAVPEQHRSKFRTFVQSLRDTSQRFKELLNETKSVLSPEEVKFIQEVEARVHRKKFIETFNVEPEQFGVQVAAT